MIKVGDVKFWKKNSKNQSIAVDYTYKDVEYDEEGWADAKKFMPADFDLVFLKVNGKKSISGWYAGYQWDSLNYNKIDKVLFWKRKPDVIE
jgi:hypothetical protein